MIRRSDDQVSARHTSRPDTDSTLNDASDSIGEPKRKRPSRAQDSDSTRAAAVKFRRIVARLEAGQYERNIAQSEGIPEKLICTIRQLELDRRNRQMSAVGTAFGTFMENIRHLHGEIDEGILEEFLERAA
jgi:hypothetical protein